MTDKDQKMLQSALWHISNSVSNGKSQTAECEITKWLKEKFNSIPAEPPSEELMVVAQSYTEKGSQCQEEMDAFIAGAQWQKEQTINKASQWLNENVVEYHPRKGELKPVVNINAFREAMEKEDEQCSTE